MSFLLGLVLAPVLLVLAPVLLVLGDDSPEVRALAEHALGTCVAWTVQLFIFGPKLARIVLGTAHQLPSIEVDGLLRSLEDREHREALQPRPGTGGTDATQALMEPALRKTVKAP